MIPRNRVLRSARTSRATCRRRQEGLSLVEFMVALSIGAFLMLGIVTVFLANKNSGTLENSLAKLQENGRFAIDLLREDIYRSQFLGCNTGDVFVINMIDDPNDPGFANAFAGVRGYERGADAAWAAVPDPNELSGDILVGEDAGGARHGSDVLSLRLTESLNPDDPNDPLLSALVLPSSTAVSVDDNPDCEIEQNDRLVLTGCNLTAHLFQVSNTQVCSPATPPNPTTFAFGAPNVTSQINTTYNLDSQLLRYEEVVWFVADTGRDIRVDGQTYDIYALFREVNGVRQEMVEGVEFMQVRFGQRVAGTTNLRFADPSDPDLNSGLNFEGVNSVRVALLVQSFEPVRDTADTRTYSLLGEDFSTTTAAAHGGLRFQREVFTATISLRNAPEF